MSTADDGEPESEAGGSPARPAEACAPASPKDFVAARATLSKEPEAIAAAPAAVTEDAANAARSALKGILGIEVAPPPPLPTLLPLGGVEGAGSEESAAPPGSEEEEDEGEDEQQLDEVAEEEQEVQEVDYVEDSTDESDAFSDEALEATVSGYTGDREEEEDDGNGSRGWYCQFVDTPSPLSILETPVKRQGGWGAAD